MIATSVLLMASALVPAGQSPADGLSFGFQAQQESRQDEDYKNGRKALDAGRWDEAIKAFHAAASKKGADADAALYWKAYAQNRAGRREEALASIRELRKAYRSSRWVDDAQALEVEIQARSGAPVNPTSEPDENLKLIALNSLMQTSPQQALPILEKFLKSNNSPKLKEKALFVLTQSSDPQARKILGGIARGASN